MSGKSKKLSLWIRIRLVRKIGKHLKQMPNINFNWSWYGSENPSVDLLRECEAETTSADKASDAVVRCSERRPGDWFVKFTAIDMLKHWRATGVNMYASDVDGWMPIRYTYEHPAAWQWKSMTCVQHGFYRVSKLLSVLVNCLFPKAIFWSFCNEILDCILKDTSTPYFFDRGNVREQAFNKVEKIFFRADSAEELELKLDVLST